MQVRQGRDGRNLVTNPNMWPYSVHGSVVIKFNNTLCGKGSGTMVGPHHVLTAGHNVYHPQLGWAREVYFIAAKNGTQQLCSSRVTKYFTVREYVDSESEEYDFALLILENSIGYRTGWIGLITGHPDLFLNMNIEISGYPGDKGSETMWTMKDQILRSEMENVRYKIDTFRGQSGSCLWTQMLNLSENKELFCTPAVHVKGTRENNPNLMFNTACRLSKVKFDLIYGWITGNFLKFDSYSSYSKEISGLHQKIQDFISGYI